MLLWILIGVVGFIILMFLVGGSGLETRIAGAIVTLVVGILVIALFSTIAYCTIRDSSWKPTRIVEHYTELVAMRMGDSMSGSFIFGSGSFGSSEQYVYMYRTKSGALKKGHQNAYKCTVRETDTTSPRRVYDRRFITTWLLPWEIRMRDSAVEFIVPTGSVTYKFEIN